MLEKNVEIFILNIKLQGSISIYNTNKYIHYNYPLLSTFYILNTIYKKEIIIPKLYKHFLSLFKFLKAGILNNPGNKFIPKGYIIDIKKLKKVSLINII